MDTKINAGTSTTAAADRPSDHPSLGAGTSEKHDISTAPLPPTALDRSISKTEEPGPIDQDEVAHDIPPLDVASPISYVCLTFDTPLPSPNTDGRQLGRGDLPACPDLSSYADPLKWPPARKGVMVAISCMATCFTAYAAGAYSESADLIAAEFNTTRENALVGVTTFCIGFAIAPMVLAPFSEINGRYPIFAVAGVVFVVFQAVCGVVTNLAGMLVARFLKGVGGSVFSTMVGGVIADMYEKEDRNTPMALFSGAVLVGTGLGPLVAAVMVQRWGDEDRKWKWVFWHQVIIDFVLMVAVVAFFKESRGSVLLSRKAKVLNKWYEQLEDKGAFGVYISEPNGDSDILSRSAATKDLNTSAAEKRQKKSDSAFKSNRDGDRGPRRIRWVVREDEQRASLATMITVSLFRPFMFLFTEPIVFFFSLWVSFAWAILYLTFGSIPLVFQRQYDFSIEQSGFVFVAMIVGSILATILGIYQEGMLKHPKWRSGSRSGSESSEADSSETGSEDSSEDSSGDGLEDGITGTGLWAFVRRKFPAQSPESRLYFTCFTSVLLPAGLYLFGFASQPSIHWMVPTFAIFLATMGIFYVYLATFNYLADIYQAYASSALAAQSFCRNVLGGAFPLVTGPLIRNLDEDAMGGLLGGIATVLTIVPWALVLFGGRIRGRSSFAIALEQK
ncbi:MFS general substrate transporter [Daldinia caldariorum]|uniref:MFS general substrate transporter n=1 Tax=Daldinia caldariorum TaxID=326644 RepID=UPI002007D3FC|nr:MFS general substrate transporter [Daldinia caldariorum]KAI1463269.1 MFS general substrate transporter [Daldinia caldariorum]